MTSSVDIESARERLNAAWTEFRTEYAHFGGHRFYGWDHADDPRNYYGPRHWSEMDCAFRFGLLLEKQFPSQVHLEMPVAGWTFADYDKAVDRRQFIDIVVSDLDGFVEDDTTQERFRTHLHTIFIEAKFFPPGCSKTWRYDHLRKVPSVLADAQRLRAHLDRGHCALAAVLIIDDDCLFEDNSSDLAWPDDVIRLIASPRTIDAADSGLPV